MEIQDYLIHAIRISGYQIEVNPLDSYLITQINSRLITKMPSQRKQWEICWTMPDIHHEWSKPPKPAPKSAVFYGFQRKCAKGTVQTNGHFCVVQVNLETHVVQSQNILVPQ